MGFNLPSVSNVVHALEQSVAKKQQAPAPPPSTAPPERHWPGANMTPQSPTRKRMTVANPPQRAKALAKMRQRMSATGGSQGPTPATLKYGQVMAKRWSAQAGKPVDPTYRKRSTPDGGMEYVLVGPDGKTYTTPKRS